MYRITGTGTGISEQETQWLQEYVFYREDKKKASSKKKTTQTGGVTSAHLIAANGNLQLLKQIGINDPTVLHRSDSNGWKPIHEAARSGHTEVIEYLIKEGADVNARTNNGNGASPLWWAEHMLPNTHPAIALLRRHGGVAIAPGD